MAIIFDLEKLYKKVYLKKEKKFIKKKRYKKASREVC